jgi:hypothetical protein
MSHRVGRPGAGRAHGVVFRVLGDDRLVVLAVAVVEGDELAPVASTISRTASERFWGSWVRRARASGVYATSARVCGMAILLFPIVTPLPSDDRKERLCQEARGLVSEKTTAC